MMRQEQSPQTRFLLFIRELGLFYKEAHMRYKQHILLHLNA